MGYALLTCLLLWYYTSVEAVCFLVRELWEGKRPGTKDAILFFGFDEASLKACYILLHSVDFTGIVTLVIVSCCSKILIVNFSSIFQSYSIRNLAPVLIDRYELKTGL